MNPEVEMLNPSYGKDNHINTFWLFHTLTVPNQVKLEEESFELNPETGVQTDNNKLIPDEADIKNIQSVLEVAIKEENDSDYEPFHGSFMVSRNIYYNGIFLPKLFWPTVRLSDRPKQCFTVLPEPNRASQLKFCLPNRNQTEPNM